MHCADCRGGSRSANRSAGVSPSAALKAAAAPAARCYAIDCSTIRRNCVRGVFCVPVCYVSALRAVFGAIAITKRSVFVEVMLIVSGSLPVMHATPTQRSAAPRLN